MTEQRTNRGTILVVDDEEAMRQFLKRTLRREGHTVLVAASVDEAQRILEEESCDLVLTDLRMPGGNGMELVGWLREARPEIGVIVMTGYGSIPSAIAALKAGAENYLTKPFDRGEITTVVANAIRTRVVAAENRVLRELLEEGRSFEGMIGTSGPMRDLYRRIDEVASRDGPVVITGETGTGKSLVARAIHTRGTRRDGPFVTFNAAGIPGELIAAELFGVEEGAYTGATQRREGAARRADGGTLFLDEITELPRELQPALLRLVEGGEVAVLGAREPVSISVRIVAATNRDVRQLADEGEFRRDLFYRLNVFSLEVPPLRRRRADIPELLRHFLARHGCSESSLSIEVRALLEAFDWPGNVRQLENVVARLVALSGDDPIGIDLLPEECRSPSVLDDEDHLPPLKAAVRRFERDYLVRLLTQTRGNISEAARRARVSRPTLHAKIAQLDIDLSRWR